MNTNAMVQPAFSCFANHWPGNAAFAPKNTAPLFDWAHKIQHQLDVEYPDAKKVLLVCDNLNTHKPASLYKAFRPEIARILLDRLEFHHTPKHGSWLNMAEIELAALTKQCLDRRIRDSEPVHIIAVETAQEFSKELGGYVRRLEVLTPFGYARLLYKLGFVDQEVKLQIYGHVLPSREAVIEWYRGTLLTTYEQRLDVETYERFVKRYREKLMKYLDDERPFFFPYKRILIWGRLGDSHD